MNRSIAPYLAALGLAVAGCKDDLKPITASWETVTAEWQTRIDALTADELAQSRKLEGLCATPGLDPGNVSAKNCVELKGPQPGDKAQLETLVTALPRQRAAVAKAISRGKGVEVSAAIEGAKTELTAMLSRVFDTNQLRGEAIKQLEETVTQELEAAKTAASAAAAKALLWKQASTERKPLELTDIRFTQGTAQLEGPEAGLQSQLEELVVWANSCPALTFSITAHESRELPAEEARKLTDGRAAAVKKFLVEHGVAPSKVIRATGNGSKTPIADEPDPLSPAAKAMNPEELEALRNKNRRITIEAVGVCPSPAPVNFLGP
jgi:outer membrane protein OmpA-like peptidoglycan-associated protein